MPHRLYLVLNGPSEAIQFAAGENENLGPIKLLSTLLGTSISFTSAPVQGVDFLNTLSVRSCM